MLGMLGSPGLPVSRKIKQGIVYNSLYSVPFHVARDILLYLLQLSLTK